MKPFVTIVMVFFSLSVFAQRNKVHDARYLQTPPLFPFGIDSCQRFYLSHFKGMDSVLYKVVSKGDTAKYIRVYFSFVVDKYGSIYDVQFEKIASTYYAKGVTSKPLNYFSVRKYYDQLIKDMMSQMPFWKPALLNGVPADCKVGDYLQFWVGVTSSNN